MPTVNWNSDADWLQFREVTVSGQDDGGPSWNPPDNELILTGAGGVGRAEGSGGTHGNDRRIYLLNGVEGSEFDMRCDFALEVQQAQFGLVARVHEPPPVHSLDHYTMLEGGMCAGEKAQRNARADAFADPGAAPLWWINILFADAKALSGVWEFASNQWLGGNQQPQEVPANDQAIDSASGDGSTVTVISATEHCLPDGQAVQLDFGPFSNTTFTATVVNDTTFSVSSAEVGNWDTGRWRLLNVNITKDPPVPWRALAIRTSGNTIDCKQWFPDCESEPAWGDPFRAATQTLPNVLADSGRRPPESGGAGIVLAHLSSDRSLAVRNLDVTVLA